jgi:molybdopterin molybdotransferase
MTWQGADASLPIDSARLSTALPPTGPREHWMRARLSSEGGAVMATPFPDQDSSLVTVFAEADALILRPIGGPAAAPGDEVAMLRLDRL